MQSWKASWRRLKRSSQVEGGRKDPVTLSSKECGLEYCTQAGGVGWREGGEAELGCSVQHTKHSKLVLRARGNSEDFKQGRDVV